MKNRESLCSKNTLRATLLGAGIALSACNEKNEEGFSQEIFQERTYLVESGDSLSKIIQSHYPFSPEDPRFKVLEEMIKKQNNISDNATIYPQQDLFLPPVPNILLQNPPKGSVANIQVDKSGFPTKITWEYQ